jgi:hypothetical protein
MYVFWHQGGLICRRRPAVRSPAITVFDGQQCVGTIIKRDGQHEIVLWLTL